MAKPDDNICKYICMYRTYRKKFSESGALCGTSSLEILILDY